MAKDPLDRNIEYRIFYLATKINNVSGKVLDRSHLILAMGYLQLIQTTHSFEHMNRYLRMAQIAYNKAMKDNSLNNLIEEFEGDAAFQSDVDINKR